MLKSLDAFKLPPKYTGVAFAFYMSAIVAFIMTAALTALNAGTGAHFIEDVLRGYVVAWPVAFVSVLLVRPLVLKLVQWTVASPVR
jgi:hypothetical protein